MPSADQALVRYEAGATPTAYTALTDSGDRTLFRAAGSPWSRRAGFEPVIRPNGLLTGGRVTPANSGTDDAVDIAAGSAYIDGVLVEWNAATDVTITRATSTDTHMICSIVVENAGATVGNVKAVVGTDHTAFSETRDATGGPPLIPLAEVELAQVRTTSDTAAAISSGEIYSVVGLHTERSDYPVYDIDYFAGTVTFVDALPAAHDDGAGSPVAKPVYATYSVPIFADVPIASDFEPPENSYSVNSTQVYGRTLGNTTASLNAGSFTAYLNDGVTDPLVGLAGQNLWFKFYPNKYQAAHIVCQGILGVEREFPAANAISASCSINADAAATNVAS